MLRLRTSGIPVAKQSTRIGKTRRGKTVAYTAGDIKAYCAEIRRQVLKQLPKGFRKMTGPVVIEKLAFVFPPLKSFSKGRMELLEAGFENVYKISRPDTDNLQKGFFDALNGVVWRDDALVCEIRCSKKVYGLKPGVICDIRVPGKEKN